ncbi:MAG: ankyrin repeat domain-containing protein [Pseudomonadota bacterium]
MTSKSLPAKANLRHLKHQAKARLRERREPGFSLRDAQNLVAEEYGFSSWRDLRRHFDTTHYDVDDLVAFADAIRSHDIPALIRVLDRTPSLVNATFGIKTLRLDGEALHRAIRQEVASGERADDIYATALWSVVFVPPQRNLEVARTLLEFGADPDATRDGGEVGPRAPIVFAAHEGGIDYVRLLLEHGADVSGEQGQMALDFAASHNRQDCVDLLIESGVRPSPFLLVAGGLKDRLLTLIERDPGLLEARDERGWNLLHAAGHRIYTGGMTEFDGIGREIGMALLEHGARHDVFSAAAFNETGLLRDLIIDPDVELADGSTPLQFAAFTGAVDALRVLLGAGADPGRALEGMNTAASHDDVEVVRVLLENGAPVSDELVANAARSRKGSTMVDLVLKHGGNPNGHDAIQWRAVHWASLVNADALRSLLVAGADPNAVCEGFGPQETNTPLHIATTGPDRIQVLIEFGADPEVRNANGQMPLDKAIREGNTESAEMLRNAMQLE